MDKKDKVGQEQAYIIDNQVFKMCITKCCSRDHTNLAG
jgi:hypothetical protein